MLLIIQGLCLKFGGRANGSELPAPIFTPTTKADEGHDEAMNVDEVAQKFGARPERMALAAFSLAGKYARNRGIIIADTKKELGLDELCRLCIADEKFTPDSSRFWPADLWLSTRGSGKAPDSFDKEPIRIYFRKWLKDHGIEKFDPKNPEHVEIVHAMTVDPKIIAETTRRYRYIFWRLSGMMLERYQRNAMGIKVDMPTRKILALIGSESDANQIQVGMDHLRQNAHGELHVMSCHRNSKELDEGARGHFLDFDAIVAGAGESSQLSGVLKAKLCENGRPDITVIGVGFKGKTAEADQAAKSAIERLPGQPVELDPNGKAYFGPEGFLAACIAATGNEFMTKKYGSKPTKLLEKF